MCGIFAFVGPELDRERLRVIARGASRRGPHAHGWARLDAGRLLVEKFPGPLRLDRLDLARGSRIVVGHCRLATTDPSSWSDVRDAQPVTDGDAAAPLVVVHNGIVPVERLAGLELATGCDSEALAVAWRRSPRGTGFLGFLDALRLVRGEPYAIVATSGTAIYACRERLPLYSSSVAGGTYLSSYPFEGARPLDGEGRAFSYDYVGASRRVRVVRPRFLAR